MQEDLNRFSSQIIHELNIRKDVESQDEHNSGYNLGLMTAITEIKKALKKWKE